MVDDVVAAKVTIGDGVGVLLPRQSLDQRIVFFILSRSGVIGVVSWCLGVAMWVKVKFDIKMHLVEDFKGYLNGIRKEKV
ncbi:hypothetical protein RHMOL_Rhmol11G0141200 [Rhododendron molle]|uniref:Uncharacterized protein n=1 Tax=Rhododendron molle TaxID=49168 RepID=A0ACC0LT61_RHOML|nr:hypothetical protein RHMOL_Rhmol11G0141200 [Rhododendron molle]